MAIMNIGTSRMVAFAPANVLGHATYLAFCQAANPDPMPGAVWYPADAVDARGRHIVAAMVPENAGIDDICPGEQAARLASGGVLEIGIARELDEG